MDVWTALLQMREELHLRQVDLAVALGVSTVTLNRWENGKNAPSRAMSLAILSFASAQNVSEVCQAALRATLMPSGEEDRLDTLKYVGVEQINDLVNDSSNGVFVCDAATCELLYVNRQICRFAGRTVAQAEGKTCYAFLFGKAAPCEHCHMHREDAEHFGAIEYDSPVTGRHYMSRSKMISWMGRRAHIEYVTDVTALQEACRERDRSRELMTVACREAGLWMFTIDLPSGTALIAPTVQEALHLPEQVPDLVDYLIRNGAVPPEREDDLRQFLAQLRRGESAVTFVTQTRFASEKLHWVRLYGTVVEHDAQDRPKTAICSAQQIDKDKALEARIQFEHNRILESRSDLMGYVVSNLTRNTVLENHRYLDDRLAVRAGTPYDAAISGALATIEPMADRAAFAKAHDRAALLQAFSQGTLGSTMAFQLRQSDGRLIWVSNELKMMLEPGSGDILLYEYCFSTHSERIVKGLLAAALDNEFEMMGAISMLSRQITHLAFSEKGALHQLIFESYEDSVKSYSERWIAPEERADYLAKISLETVCEKLKTCRTYRVLYRTMGENAESTKLAQFTWYDEKRQFCLASVMDLTHFMAMIDRL